MNTVLGLLPLPTGCNNPLRTLLEVITRDTVGRLLPERYLYRNSLVIQTPELHDHVASIGISNKTESRPAEACVLYTRSNECRCPQSLQMKVVVDVCSTLALRSRTLHIPF